MNTKVERPMQVTNVLTNVTMNVTEDSGRCDILMGEYHTDALLAYSEFWEPLASEDDTFWMVEASESAKRSARAFLARGKRNVSTAKQLVREAMTKAKDRGGRIQFNSEHFRLKKLRRMPGAVPCTVTVFKALDGRMVVKIERVKQ